MGFFMTSLAVTLHYKEKIYNEISSQLGQNSSLSESPGTTTATTASLDLEDTKLVLDILPAVCVILYMLGNNNNNRDQAGVNPQFLSVRGGRGHRALATTGGVVPQQSQGYRLGCHRVRGLRHDLRCCQDLPLRSGISQSCWHLWLLCGGKKERSNISY